MARRICGNRVSVTCYQDYYIRDGQFQTPGPLGSSSFTVALPTAPLTYTGKLCYNVVLMSNALGIGLPELDFRAERSSRARLHPGREAGTDVLSVKAVSRAVVVGSLRTLGAHGRWEAEDRVNENCS